MTINSLSNSSGIVSTLNSNNDNIRILEDEKLTSLYELLTAESYNEFKELLEKRNSPIKANLIELRIKNSELPAVYREEIDYLSCYEIDVCNYLFYRVFYYFSHLSAQSSDKYKSLFNDYCLMTPLICSIFGALAVTYGDSGVVKQNKRDNFLDVIENMRNKLLATQVNLPKNGQETVIRVLSILNEMKKSLNFEDDALPLTYYVCTLQDIMGRAIPSVCGYDNILRKSRQISKIFQQVHSILLFDDYESLLLKRTKEIFDSYAKNIKKKKKKPIKLQQLFHFYHYTMEKFRPFFDLTHKLDPYDNSWLFQVAPRESMIDYQKYGLGPFRPSKQHLINIRNKKQKQISANKIDNVNTYKLIGKLMRVGMFELRMEVLHMIMVQELTEGVELNIPNVKSFINSLDNFLSKAKLSQISKQIDPSLIFSICGEVNMEGSFQYIVESIQYLKVGVGKVLNSQSDYPIYEYYNCVSILDFNLKDFLTSTLGVLVEVFNKEVTEIAQMRKINSLEKKERLKLKACENRLSKNLSTLSSFLTIFEEQCRPILESIEDFHTNFLKPKSQPKTQELVNKVEENQNVQIIKAHQKNSHSGDDLYKSNLPSQKKSVSNNQNITQNLNSGSTVSDEDILHVADKLQKKLKAVKKKKEKGEYLSIHNVKWKTLVQEVIDAGYVFLRQKGSHMQYKHPNRKGSGVITIPKHKTLSTGVVRETRKQINQG